MNCPTDASNLCDDEVIRDPWPHYTRLREKGPVVWMEALGNYAFTQYDVVHKGLRDHETFISGLGTAADDFGCQHQRGNTVASDPTRHTVLRHAILPPLKPDNIADIRPRIQAVANEIVNACFAKRSFDVVSDLAQPMPLQVVQDLIGLPDFGKDNMLKWASAAFDMQGVQNQRGQAARGVIAGMRDFISKNATADTLKLGSWTHRISEMIERGELDPELAPFAIRDYINPSLDTTISAIGHLMYHASFQPDIWEKISNQPALASKAAHEAVRIGTPIRSFSRHTSKPVEVAGHTIPQGARVMMLYASANRDESIFPEADRFDVERRNARRNLGFGAGIHMCAGMHLAILEIECLIHAIAARSPKFEIGVSVLIKPLFRPRIDFL